MTDNTFTSSTDIPITKTKQDRFGISPYIDALCAFIKNSNTPMTIAIQGEWGCGKSSFMNLIRQKLCDPQLPDQERFEPIFINAWEFFLEEDYSQAVSTLSKNIIYQIAEHFEELQKRHISEGRKEVARQAAETIAKAMLNFTNVGSDTLDGVRGIVGTFKRNTNSTLRNRQEIERVILQDDSCRAFLIFVDDLDRLSPPMAVTLMEAMKVLFDIKKCVFILAVDYEVIANGIELKYGRTTAGNRDIAKDFFDKLIQLPFHVPMNNYRIRNYLQDELQKIGFFTRPQDYVTYIDEIEQIFVLATRKNPRTMKSVLNMFLALDLLDGKINNKPDFQMIELLLVVFQKCYPKIYRMLSERSSLNQWDAEVREPVSQQSIDLYGLDSPWKMKLYLRFRDEPQMMHNLYRIFKLLELYEKYQKRCLQAGESYGELFSLLDLMVGQSVQTSESRYDGREYDAHSEIQKKQGNRLISEIGDFSDFRTVLDVGCGNGKTTIELWEKNTAMRIKAIDNSESQLNVALEHYDRKRQEFPVPPAGSIEFLLEDAAELSGTGAYDLVFSNAAIHWIGSGVYPLLFRALRPGGLLAVHQGAKGTYGEYHDMARRAIRELGYESYYENWKLPVYYPDRQEMEQLLKQCGFQEIRVTLDETFQDADEALTEAFIAASLSAYQSVLEPEMFETMKEKFRELCKENLSKITVSRLYILALKSPEE